MQAKDIQFDIDRGQLAFAVNLAMLKQMIFEAISARWAEKLVFPNCQGLSLTNSLDILDVKRPRVEGCIVLKICSVDGLPEPGGHLQAKAQSRSEIALSLWGTVQLGTRKSVFLERGKVSVWNAEKCQFGTRVMLTLAPLQ